MQCTTNLTREIMESICAGGVNRPTRLFVSVGFGGGLQPISTSKKYGFNKWLLSRIQASNVGQHTYYMGVVYIFIHGRPLGSYDTTLRQNHI